MDMEEERIAKKCSWKGDRSPVMAESNSRKEMGEIQLKRELGVAYGVAIIIGLTVGGGIYITPQTVLRNAGSPALTLIIWLVGGIKALFGALVSAEIGIHIPVAGEGYSYLCELYNPYFGFIYVWQHLLLVRPGSNALKFIIFSRYLLKPLFQYCEVPILAILLLATTMCGLVTFLNCMNLKFMARGQSSLSFLSVSTLTSIAVLGIYFLVTGCTENLEDPFRESRTDPGSLIMALYATMFSYNGWSALNFLIEELKNPNRTLPVAIVLSNILLTILYVFVNLTYVAVLSKDEALSSEAIAISVVMKISVIGGWIMSVFIAITAYSSSNSGHLVSSRLAFAASRNGHFPSALSFISITQFTPMLSVIFVGFVTSLFIWAFELEFILMNVMFSGIFGDLLISVGYLTRRFKLRKQVDSKFKVPIFVHVVHGTALFVFTLIPLVTNPLASAVGFFLVILTSSIYYLIFIRWKKASYWNGADKVNIFIQKLFNCAPAQKDL